MELRSTSTRFRAYQLGTTGSSFSYFDGYFFTLIEARLTYISVNSLIDELQICGKDSIDILHITSWDEDHCKLFKTQTD
jgi:competence protein ComEC